ncbi:MAG: hypothetical protein RLZZ383_434 [Pseudomonadota bacterium]
MTLVAWCSPFDAALAASDVAAVFLLDREGLWRFDETWTRDAFARESGPHRRGAAWRLLRDRATGWVTLVHTNSPDLLSVHPRADVRTYGSLDEALAARAAFGNPPIAKEVW